MQTLLNLYLSNWWEEATQKGKYSLKTFLPYRQHCRLNICSYIGSIDKYWDGGSNPSDSSAEFSKGKWVGEPDWRKVIRPQFIYIHIYCISKKLNKYFRWFNFENCGRITFRNTAEGVFYHRLDLGIGLVWDNHHPHHHHHPAAFWSECWNPLQTELNNLWQVLSCSQDDIRWFKMFSDVLSCFQLGCNFYG